MDAHTDLVSLVSQGLRDIAQLSDSEPLAVENLEIHTLIAKHRMSHSETLKKYTARIGGEWVHSKTHIKFSKNERVGQKNNNPQSFEAESTRGLNPLNV